MSPEKPKVVYILGAHRSGSTVLGVTLGNCTDFFFAGELHSWLSRGGVPSFGGVEGARLWRAVSENVGDATDLYGYEAQFSLERSSALFRLDKWPARRRLRKRYRQVSEKIYCAIAKATGENYVVDSSHYPLRAHELQALDGIDLYLLFLVRDPQGVVTSFDSADATSYSKSPLTTNLQLWVTHLLSTLVFLRHPPERRLFLRHEDFLANPGGVLRQILDCVGSPAAIPDLTALSTGSPLQGNRFLNRSNVIALKGPKASPVRESLMTTLLQLPLRPVLSRLRPAVTAASAREHAAAGTPG